MLLWVSIALLTLAVTAALVWPLVSPRTAPAGGDDLDARIAVFRDRRREIERERQAGRLSDTDAERAQADLLVQMAEELPADRATVPGSVRHSRPALAIALLLAVAVPILAVGVYRSVGAPDIARAQLDGSFEQMLDTPQARFDALLAEIEQRLRANPDDGEAWAVLAEAHKLTGQHGAAVEAFEKAVELLPPNARLLADYAESTALVAGGDFSGRPTELLEQALRADPGDVKAIALMGAARYRAGDLPQARHYLGKLLAGLPEGSDDAARIGDVIARIDREMANRGLAAAPAAPPPAPTPAPATGSAPAAPGAVTPPTATPSATAAASGATAIHGRVEIAPELAAGLPAQAALFVIARAAEGPRIPVAALRIPATSLPLDFSLDDGNAMDPSRPLSAAGPLIVEARVSLSGTAARAAGDLIGPPVRASAGDRDIALRIDQVFTP